MLAVAARCAGGGTKQKNMPGHTPFLAIRRLSVQAACVLALGGLAAVATAQEPTAVRAVADPATEAESVLETDRRAADLARERGLRASYESHLADDAVLFRPLPESAAAWFASHEPPSGQTTWTPLYARVACDGSLAVTSGTWTYAASDGRPAESGKYLTAWRRDDTGAWRIVAEQSILAPASAAPQPFDAAPAQGCPRGEGRRRALESADRRAGTELHARDPRGTEVEVPVRPLMTGAFMGGPAADLALTHGELVAAGRGRRAAEPAILGVYLRLWTRQGREWSLQRDMVTPVGTNQP
jgi:ketosteroid isomerase-like protein